MLNRAAARESGSGMTAEEHHSEDSERQEPASAITSDDFAAVDVEAPIRDSRNVDCLTLGSLYQTAASEAEANGDEAAAKVFALLFNIANIWFKPEDRAEPYGPLYVSDQHRALIPADLRGEQSAAIAELVPAIRNRGLRARLADIAWQNDRKLASMSQHAIDAYCDSVRLVLDGKAEFSDVDRGASGYEGSRMLRRACQLAHATGWKDPGASELRALIGTVIRDAIDRVDHRGFLDVSEVALGFRIDDPAAIALDAEKFATSGDVDPHSSHDLWELAARAHSGLQNAQDRDRCLVGAAESYLRIAEAEGGEGMVAAAAIMDAIQALRALPNTGQRRKELERRLRHAQASVRDEMGSFSTSFDVTDFIQRARESVGGKSLAQALGEFAALTPSPHPEDLREQARRVAAENPLSSIMPSTMVDDDAKVVAKSPGMVGDESNTELALHHLIARHEGLRRHIAVRGLIEPARHVFQAEHPLDERHLRLIVAMTPFVSADRVDLVTMGLARFFGGDFFSALHILVPQIEHSLRHILKHVGVDPSTIRDDMTQEDRTLSPMLTQERGSLEGVLGPAIVFEIENLFVFRAGPVLRHRLAHGLVSADECYDSDSIFACWFIYRLFCLPLFSALEGGLISTGPALASEPVTGAHAPVPTSLHGTAATSTPSSRRGQWREPLWATTPLDCSLARRVSALNCPERPPRILLFAGSREGG